MILLILIPLFAIFFADPSGFLIGAYFLYLLWYFDKRFDW